MNNIGGVLSFSRQIHQGRTLVGFLRSWLCPISKNMQSNHNSSTLRFVKISQNACLPKKGSMHAAGYDLQSAYDYVIPSRGKALCLTDLKVAVPEGTYGRIAPRSGLAHKNFIDVGAGVIDYDYRGNIGIILFNFSEQNFEVKRGDRIAQLICEKICYPDVEEVESLDDTERSDKGYGSTGTN